MTEAALTISFTDSDSETATANRRFVHLEQIKESESKKTVTMYDLKQMVARAKSGLSARTYKPDKCPAYIDGNSVVSWFNFYSWPSSLTLPHTIGASLGNVSPPKMVEKAVDFSATFELSDTIEFDFMLTEVTSARWETPCYDKDGKVVDDLDDPVMDGLTTMRVDKPVFGVVRIKGKKKGGQHEVNVRLVKTIPNKPDGTLPTEEEWIEAGGDGYGSYQDYLDQYYGFTDIKTWESNKGNEIVPNEPINMTGLSITNLQVTVIAKWFDDGEEQSESLRMEIPQCLKDLLEACDGDGSNADGDQSIFNMCGSINGDGDPIVNVYISSCTGIELAAIEEEQDENSWCGKK